MQYPSQKASACALRRSIVTLVLLLAAPLWPAQQPRIVPDSDAPPKTDKLTPRLRYGGKLGAEFKQRNRFDFEAARSSVLEPELELAFAYEPEPKFRAYLNFALKQELSLDEHGRTGPTELEVDQAFLEWKAWLSRAATLRLGRQRFADEREWLYDEQLDAIRLFVERGAWSFQLSASRQDLVDGDLLNEQRSSRYNNYFVYGTHGLRPNWTAAAYAFAREDRSNLRDASRFFGLRSHGEITQTIKHWIELAAVRGRDAGQRVRGYAVDAGVITRWQAPFDPAVTVGYALATGDDDPDDGTDRNFRQTGLEENEGYFDGIVRFKYYGELIDPELSNFKIFTLGFGVRPAQKISVDLVYHSYRQHRASDGLRDSALRASPAGLSRDLGKELDLVVGYRGIKDFPLGIALGYFSPGKAFGARTDSAFFARIEVEWEF